MTAPTPADYVAVVVIVGRPNAAGMGRRGGAVAPMGGSWRRQSVCDGSQGVAMVRLAHEGPHASNGDGVRRQTV